MKLNSALRLKHVAWASAGVLVVVLIFFAARSGAKPTAQAPPPPVVEVAPVEQKDIPVYREWIGTLSGQVNADIKAQVTGYLLTRNYKEGSYVTKGELLFEIDPRPFQAALDQAKGQLAQAEAQLAQGEAQLATAEANQLKSQLDVEKYGPLAKADAVSKQDFDNAVQTNLANKDRRCEGSNSSQPGSGRNRDHQPQLHPNSFAHRRYRRNRSGASRRFSQYQQRNANNHLDARPH